VLRFPWVGKGKRVREQRRLANQQQDQQADDPPNADQSDDLQQVELWEGIRGAPRMPVFCDHCGLIFPSQGFAFANETQATLGSIGEICPRCRQVAYLPSGTFNIVGDTLEVLEATPLTRARLSQLADVLDRARRGEIAEDDVADEIEREGGSTALADLLRKAPPKLRHALILILIFAVGQLAQYEVGQQLSDSPSRAELQHGLSALSEQLRDDQQQIHGDVETAVRQALAAYNHEHRPPPSHSAGP
jgi:hypothetical protein